LEQLVPEAAKFQQIAPEQLSSEPPAPQLDEPAANEEQKVELVAEEPSQQKQKKKKNKKSKK
jgi:hypothetical protein